MTLKTHTHNKGKSSCKPGVQDAALPHIYAFFFQLRRLRLCQNAVILT